MVVSLIALFVALGGTTYAATSLPRNSVGTKQLKKNAVTSPKIKNGAVNTTKLAAGAVTPSNFGLQPDARVRNSSDESISSSSLTALTFNTEDFDTASIHSTSTNTQNIVVPISGIYLLGAGVRWSDNTAGRRIVLIYVNGVQAIRDAVSPNNTSGFGPEQNPHGLYKLSAGDVVSVEVWQDSGSTLSVQSFGASGPYLEVAWLAP